MRFGDALNFTNRFKEIKNADVPVHIKDQRLSSLMSDLELMYDIPAQHDERFEQENPLLMQFYRTIAAERSS